MLVQVQAFNYLSICKMPEYSNKSFEELRCEDYQKGNKGTAQPTPGLGGVTPFGATTSPFGAAAPAAAATPFGAPAASPFGAAAPAAAASPFGAAAGAAPAFGAAPSPFGAAPKPAFGAAPAPGAGGAPGAFGSVAPGGFGAAAPSPFGAATPGAPGASLFGAAPAPGAGAKPFGAAAPAAAAPSPFGAAGLAAPSPFGAPAAGAAPFGATPAAGANPFAPKPAASPFGVATPGLGGGMTPFGAPAPGATPSVLGGGLGAASFGTPGAAAPSLFGAAMPGVGAAPGALGANPFAVGGATMAAGMAGQPTQVVMAAPGASPYTQLPPAPSTNPYPYGCHALFTPVSGAGAVSTPGAAANPATAPAAAPLMAPAAATTGMFGALAAPQAAPPAATPQGAPVNAATLGVSPACLVSAEFLPTAGSARGAITLLARGSAAATASANGAGVRAGAGTHADVGAGGACGATAAHPLPLDDTLTAFSPSAELGASCGSTTALAAPTPARSRSMGAATQLQTPLVGFRSPRALDIDADSLTAAAAQPLRNPSIAAAYGASAALSGSGGAPGSGQPTANGALPTPATRDGYAAPQPRRGPLPQVTVDELLYTGLMDEDEGGRNLGAGGEGGDEGGEGGGNAAEEDREAPPTGFGDESGDATVAAAMSDDDSLRVRPYGLDVLRRMSSHELSEIDGFELSAPGCGRMRWPGRTDVRDLLDQLGDIVKFRVQGVSVYEGAPKPPPGEGLNKQCFYTMENVWVRDRNTGEFLTDAKSIGAFRGQLHRKADRMGARMVDYDHQKGEWTVEVAHF